MTDTSKEQPRITAGLDLGDRYSYLCLLDTDTGETLLQSRVRTTAEGLCQCLRGEDTMTIALEVGTHSPWVSRLLEDHGHHVLVANPRKTRLIYSSKQKTDKLDAEKLARMARLDPKLLYPMEHRTEQTQAHRAVIQSRDVLVRSRGKLINHLRGTVKSFGARLPGCSAPSFHAKAADAIPDELSDALQDVVDTIATLTEKIRGYDKRIQQMCNEHYPLQTGQLTQIPGVGPLTALSFVLTLEDPARFPNSRAVGAYLGLVPGKDQSGEQDPQQRISKQGDKMLRRLLVSSAHYILGPFGQDCDLRRHGEKLAAQGGKNARKRAAVAVARKLTVLLHHLWVTGEVYDPLYNARLTGTLPREAA